ncbi:MAG: hypothetical protein M5U12_03420 [Verrucomicrobia bacterium]|nr:hypothetical protein [Verrucomicrobiota bacterium]
MVNNLIAYNSSGVAVAGRVPQIRHNLTWGNTRANYELIPDPTGTNGNVSLPPKLVGPYGDPHLASDSPARDAGDTSVVQADWLDLDGKARVSGDGVDIGADEYDGTVYEIPRTSSMSRPKETTPGPAPPGPRPRSPSAPPSPPPPSKAVRSGSRPVPTVNAFASSCSPTFTAAFRATRPVAPTATGVPVPPSWTAARTPATRFQARRS